MDEVHSGCIFAQQLKPDEGAKVAELGRADDQIVSGTRIVNDDVLGVADIFRQPSTLTCTVSRSCLLSEPELRVGNQSRVEVIGARTPPVASAKSPASYRQIIAGACVFTFL